MVDITNSGEIDEKMRNLTNVRAVVMTSIISALALVVGLFWNDAIKSAIDEIIPQGQGLWYKFAAALMVTVIVVVIIYVVMHSQKAAEKRLREIKSGRKKGLFS
ncbi:MAG TPA: DUF5654 family protein [archaeon]|nr:DUF5654 family protein [archaeon]